MAFDNRDSLYYVFREVIKFHYYRTYMLLDEVGIYPGQPAMLHTLSEEDGQSQTDIAKNLNIKPATVTVMLNRMEKSGLLERRQDPEDQRVSRVYITEEGRNMYEKVRVIWDQIDSECFGNLTETEQDILRGLLMQVRGNLESVCDRRSNI